MNNNYFSTGEFAKLCNVNKKTLFYYDEIDLFKPELVMENGYRYYSIYQLEIFYIIHILKDLGVPLKEIKEFMDNRNPKNVVEIFENKTREIEDEISRLRKKQEIISNKIKTIKECEKIREDISIEEQDEEYLFLSYEVDKSKWPYDSKLYMQHLNYCYENDLYIGYPIGLIKTKDDLYSENKDDYTYYYSRVNENKNENITIKPKGRYVVGYIKDSYVNISTLYDRLLDYIKINNLEIIGYAYEDALLDSVSVKDMKDYIMKVSIHIK